MAYKSILVIDDEAEIREVLRAFLIRNGYKVVTANDGLQGIKAFEENPIDLVITDLLMPEQEGIETMMQIREKRSDVPIIAISGGGRMAGIMDILQTAKLLGAARTFSKPFNPLEVVEAVRQLTEPSI